MFNLEKVFVQYYKIILLYFYHALLKRRTNDDLMLDNVNDYIIKLGRRGRGWFVLCVNIGSFVN